MIPHHFHGQTHVLEAPQGWDHKERGECGCLPIMARDGYLTSVWRPSADELTMLNSGGGIVLHIAANAHPVVALDVCAPEGVLVSA